MPAGPKSKADKQPVANSPQFPMTMWSMIQSAKNEDDSLVGLERLARAYWQPLYVVARQRGSSHEAAADEVQGFFEYLLSHEVLKNVQRGEVRFRSFLLRCFTNWLVNEYNRSQAAKRGGGATLLSVDDGVVTREIAGGEHQRLDSFGKGGKFPLPFSATVQEFDEALKLLGCVGEVLSQPADKLSERLIKLCCLAAIEMAWAGEWKDGLERRKDVACIGRLLLDEVSKDRDCGFGFV